MAALSLHGSPDEEDEAWDGLRQKGPLGTCGGRRKRRFVPEEEKDATYWEKRRKNNQAAKLSRDKRRVSDHVLQKRLTALSVENQRLRAELTALNLHLTRLCAAPYPSLPRLAPQPAPSPSPYGVPPMVPLPNLSTLQYPLSPLAGLGFFLAPTILLPRISYPPPLDLQGARTSRPPCGAVLRSGGQRGGSEKEGEQKVPGDPSSSSALPHKLHLKTHNTAPPCREWGRQHSPGMHFYGSD